MAISSDHHPARKRVVLEHNLVNDSATWTPKTNAVLGRHALQEVVHLAVVVNGDAEINLCSYLGQNQVIAMNR